MDIDHLEKVTDYGGHANCGPSTQDSPAALQLAGSKDLILMLASERVYQMRLTRKLCLSDEYTFFALWCVHHSPAWRSKCEACRGKQQPLCNHEAR